MNATRIETLSHLTDSQLIAEFKQRAAADSRVTLESYVLCAFDDYELTEQQFKFLCDYFDHFRNVC